MLLRIDKRLVVHVVELHFAVSEGACGTQQRNQAVFSFRSIQQSCHQLEVVYKSDVHVVVGQLGNGFDNRSRALEVRTLSRADTIGQRAPCRTSVSGRACHLTKRSVVGDGQSSVAQCGIECLVLSVFHFRKVDQVCRNQVCVIVIITILRRRKAVRLHLFISYEVCFQRFVQLL